MKYLAYAFFLIPFVGFNQNLDEARLEFNRYEYEKSAQLFNAVQADQKLKTQDLKMLAYANYVSADWEKCLTNVNQLIEEKSADPMHYLMRADALKALSRFEEASVAYELYHEKEPNDYVAVDIASCAYLPSVTALTGMQVSNMSSNTKKADMLFWDAALGTILFHEIGADSVRTKMTLENVDLAELMLLRPFVIQNGVAQLVTFPEKFDFYSVSSFSKDPNSNQVVFTAYGLLDKHGLYRSPQLYVGSLLADQMTVTDIALWQHAHPDLGESAAFANYVPGTSTIVFSRLIKDSKTYSDFYFSTWKDGAWSAPTEVANVNTAGEEEYILFAPEHAYFSSTGRPGYGAMDIYMGDFDTTTHSFGQISHLPAPINSASDEFYYFGATDTSYITSNRFGAHAEDDVWILINESQIAEKAAELARQKALSDSLELQAILSWTPPKIYYDFDTDNPNTDYSFLHQLAEILKNNSGIDVEVIGYTDVRGTEEYNKFLSYNRAKFVKTQLIEKGIPENRILIKGEGKSVAQENSHSKSSEEVHQSNRYVLITLVKAD